MRYLLCILVALLVSSEINSQIIKSIGIESGICIAKQKGVYVQSDKNLETNYDSRIGPNILLRVEGPSTKHISLITVFGYIPKGFKSEFEDHHPDTFEGLGTYTTYENRYDLLSLSPMVKGMFEIGHFIPYAFIGLRLDYLISYEMDIEYTSSYFNDFIIGLNLGAGIEYKFKSAGIFMQGYYQPDLSALYSRNDYYLYNKAFIINLGLKYYFKAKNVQESQ